MKKQKSTNKELLEMALENMTEGIQSVLKGDKKSFKMRLVCMNDVCKYLESIGATESGDLDTNGWQWDAWQNYKYKGKEYCIEAGGFYGTIEFNISEEEE